MKSPVRTILIISVCSAVLAAAAPTHLVDEKPVQIIAVGEGVHLLDFGRVAFGNLRLIPPADGDGVITVHFGEDSVGGRVNRKPPGTVRYKKTTVTLTGQQSVVVAPSADQRNTRTDGKWNPPAILTPAEWGVLLPFRWVEIEGWDGDLLSEQVFRQSAYASAWDDHAASFESSDEMLNRIWELCRYSIKATTFAGVYVDGDRERIPYEADAYLNQLSHYYTDNDIQMARDTFDVLMRHPTWPTEWASHMIFMAYADWMHTGDAGWLRACYESLESKLLLNRRGENHLVLSDAGHIKKGDLVDWPPGERDGYVFTEINTVVNAFHIRSLFMMAELADALGLWDDVAKWQGKAEQSQKAFQSHLFDPASGRYIDGVGTGHQSFHANLFPLAFGLVPEERRELITQWLVERGMRCSVYGAQYFMEALFEHGADTAAVALMTAPGNRSWRHMVESGATITWEAWDQEYKPNQDWNHAWGAAPANLLPRYILGVEAAEAGWELARIRPFPSGLEFARGRVPTPHGAIEVEWSFRDEFTVSVKAPEGMKLRLELPKAGKSGGVFSDGRHIEAEQVRDRWVFEAVASGTTTYVVR